MNSNAIKATTGLREVDVSICNIFSGISHGCYRSEEMGCAASKSHFHRSIVPSFYITDTSTYTEAIQTLLTGEL